MTERERFLATLRYQDRDRSPISDFGFWDETLVIWREQGLPEWVDKTNTDRAFGMDNYEPSSGINPELCPWFPYEVLEDRGENEVVQQIDGVRVLKGKFMGSIPQHLEHLLVDRESWEKHYKPRLDPAHPDRFPADLETRARSWRDPARETVLGLFCGSLFGRIRDWMGVENVSYVVYDDPAFFEEMVTTVADCIYGTLERILATGGIFDCAHFWEDMCFNNGPLLSPTHFRRFIVPHYRRITDLLHRHGIDIIWVDCDGKIDALIPHWMEAGVNAMFPIEVGTWGADPVALRREYGNDLLLIGGFDKHILARSTAEIDAEIRRLTPLVEAGGFIPLPDHRVPPDVSLRNYLHYLDRARHIWGRDTHLRPMEVSLATLASP
ncbi:MAG: uroporphyrinogen decarboxylase family protein [Opitutaceae bacterium]